MYDKKNTDDMVQRYKDEMMRLYRQNKTASISSEQTASKPAQKAAVQNPINSASKANNTSAAETAEHPKAQASAAERKAAEMAEQQRKLQSAAENAASESAVHEKPQTSAAERKAAEMAEQQSKFRSAADIMGGNLASSGKSQPDTAAENSFGFFAGYNQMMKNTYAGNSVSSAETALNNSTSTPSKFRPADDIMNEISVPTIAVPEIPRTEMPYHAVTNRDDEDTYPVEDDGSDYMKEEPEQAEPDEEDYSDMPRPPDIEIPPEVMQILEQGKTTEEETLPPAHRERSEEYSTDITADLVNETGDTDTGYLQVEVTAADNAVPIKNAVVIVSRKTNGNNYLLSVLSTNSSGRTPAVNLPAPPKGLPDEPDVITPQALHADYQVRVEADGFYPAFNPAVPVFALIKSIQPFELTPLPEYTVQPVQKPLKSD